MLAWHFVGKTLRDGQAIPPDGVTLYYKNKLIMCASGFHASKKLLDALKFAPGSTLCRVRLGGQILSEADKCCASERTILWRIDATKILQSFARKCALDVIYLWKAPQVVIRFLKTGDHSIQQVAADTTRAAADAATYAAAYAASSAVYAASSATYAAADAAVYAAYAAYAAVYAASSATYAAADAAYAATRARQERRLVAMVHAAHDKEKKSRNSCKGEI